jgi:cytochrome c oxidase subunit 3/cytochrome o ubiquinol oxidase subunit 3
MNEPRSAQGTFDVSFADPSPSAAMLPETAAAFAEDTFRPNLYKVGMICFLCSEAAFFGTLLATYATYLGKSLVGPFPGEALGVRLPAANTVFLVASSATVARASAMFARGRVRSFLLWLGATFALGLLFLGGTAWEWTDLIAFQGLTLQRNLFGTTFFTLIGFHAGHVTVGLLIMLVLSGLVLARQVNVGRSQSAELLSWYWHFVDGVWITIIFLVYIFGR